MRRCHAATSRRPESRIDAVLVRERRFDLRIPGKRPRDVGQVTLLHGNVGDAGAARERRHGDLVQAPTLLPGSTPQDTVDFSRDIPERVLHAGSVSVQCLHSNLSQPADAMTAARSCGRFGVLLMQLGGPERLEELEPFLYELFADPEVLRIPVGPLRRFVARTIARRRAPGSATIYEAIGWSPIRRLTEMQRRLLEEELERRHVGDAPAPRAYMAMVCSAPHPEEVLAQMARDGITHALLLPLFPQYSFTTTRSSTSRVRHALRVSPLPAVWRVQGSWYREPGFLDAHVARIREALSAMPGGTGHILYSAHSLPRSLVEKHGDPYQREIEETVALVNARLGGSHPWSLAYQSKVGPVAWLGPSTPEELARLGAAGVESVAVVPIAFVTEHVETLYEIAILFSEDARRAGIREFRPVAALDGHPRLVEALADLCEGHFRADSSSWGASL